MLCLAAMATVDHYSLIDKGISSPEQKGKVSKKRSQENGTGVSAAIAAQNQRIGNQGQFLPRFPGEDSGRSLAGMARADLDAALQLLADRAQYITGASGAAIALRRSANNDMLCRARVGSNAPELGALLSMEYGLSGESVRTGQLLLCDDAERDPRVNRDLCRELGIASVVVMPILKEQQVLGIFEILSGKAKAFNERDFSALTRLAEMVVTAVKHSGLELESVAPPKAVPRHESTAKAAQVKDLPTHETAHETKPALKSPAAQAPLEIQSPKSESAPAKKPLFWSAALQAQASARTTQSSENSALPPVLRNLRKCESCGFPISQGRTFCVECEEKHWQGRVPERRAADESTENAGTQTEAPWIARSSLSAHSSAAAVAVNSEPVVAKLAMGAAASAGGITTYPVTRTELTTAPESVAPVLTPTPLTEMSAETTTPQNPPEFEPSTLFSASTGPSQSWLAANKYVLLALLIVALVVAGIALFH